VVYSSYMFKKFVLKKLLGSKLKAAGVSDEQMDMILALVEKNPEFFQKIQKEVEAKKKQGISEQAAMMTIMREHQAEFQKILSQK
jgi:deferrochelatase/peroxidase EfeB